MALVAGVDIGNSTTEIVIADGKTTLACDRRPTRGSKGSEVAARAAAALLRNLERSAGVKVRRVVVAPWHPVKTQVATLHKLPPDTGRIQIVSCAQHSVRGDACATGRPWNISAPPPEMTPVVAVVMQGIGYKAAVERINSAIEQGFKVTGVIVADDEAVLIATRLSVSLPVVDRADCHAALGATKLFIEVRPSGQGVNIATDVWALQRALEVQEQERDSLILVSRWVGDLRAVIIGYFEAPVNMSPVATVPSLTYCSGETVGLIDAVALMRSQFVGAVSALNRETVVPTRDVWAVDIDRTLADRGIRFTGQGSRIALATLCSAASETLDGLSAIFEAAVTIADSETKAALLGAGTTPGLPDKALILDIGGGTIDLISEAGGITAAGAGELLSAAVAEVLDVPKGAADWIKRGPAQRVDSVRALLSENGSCNFVSASENAIPAKALGMLVTPGPAGLLPFGRNLQLAEWRIIRQSLKQEVIASNVSRILQTYRDKITSEESFDIVIVGGPAEDNELLPVLGRLPEVKGLGRGNVAGSLGHRFAVAYGLTQLCL